MKGKERRVGKRGTQTQDGCPKSRRVGKMGAHKRKRNENEAGCPNVMQDELARTTPNHMKSHNKNDHTREH
jgi:hypothetical protein